MVTVAHILSQYSIQHGYSRPHTVTIHHTAWLQQPTYCVNTAWLQLPKYCHNTAYSTATAAHILSQYSLEYGYSSPHIITIQHTAWLQQPTYCLNTAWLQLPKYCYNTAYSTATAAHILSQYSIQHGYSSPHTVTIQHTAWLQ